VAKNLGITITDIRPGFIDTPMTKKNKGMFWLETSENAAKDIARAIEQKKQVAYIPAKWVIPSWVMRLTPDYFWYRK
jgi:short-subunit dehydrogenase